MRPILFTVAGIPVPAFFTTIMVGALLMTFATYRLAGQRKLSQVVVLDMGIIGILASVVGARIFHVLVEYPAYYWADPWRIFHFWEGGFVSLGAYMAAVIAWAIYFRWRRLPILPYFDMAGETCPIIDFFVRLGCLLIGCCYGRPTHSFLHIIFTNPGSTAAAAGYGNIPLHPSQIYFMLNAVVAYFIMRWLGKRRRFAGQLTAAFLIYYGITRFGIEFTRGDADRGLFFHHTISTGQLVMLLFIIAGIIVYGLGTTRKGTSPDL